MNRKSFFLLLLIGAFVFRLQAVPAFPYPVKVNQPDGTSLTVVLRGDEFHKFHQTADGYLLAKDKQGVFNYARQEPSGNIVSTGVKASEVSLRNSSERSFVASLQNQPEMRETTLQIRAKRAAQAALPSAARFPTKGSPRSLVILVNFSNLKYVIPSSQTAFTALLNEKGYTANGGTGSARDYFRDNSTGTFTPQFDVVGPFNLPNNYKFYGENDPNDNDNDKNPVQMIVDACAKADSAGVDFSIYDTDNDGIVDNVFVYYAGYNEAEWGSDDTVWPHRWGIYPTAMYGGGNYTGSVASVTFDGKRVEDYACTSELRGNSGSNMAGIGTFTHEFGHVLGLADMYATDGADHQTLSYWNIMDGGAYLNSGRTPPAYNAFERFQLGYLTPTLLPQYPQNVTLDTLTTSNKAYLISPTEAHNLNASNPNPVEFFLLENRQKAGWDKALPGNGMLVYRIVYNKNDWENNVPNNDPAKMGVDIMEADGIASDATLSGDPFPGTANKTSYELVLRAGTKLYKKISNITETGGIIAFKVDKIAAIETNATSLSFTAEVNATSALQNITVTSVNLSGTGLTCSITGTDASMFTLNGNGTLPLSGGTLVLSFTPASEGQKTATLKITDGITERLITLAGTATQPPLGAPQVPADASTIVTGNQTFTAVWNAVTAAESYRLKVYTKSESSTTFKSMLAENFDKFSGGTSYGSPTSADIGSSLNDYTQQPGWTGAKIYQAIGSAKIGSSSGLGTLTTPAMNLSADGGKFTLSFDAMAWNGDDTSMKIFLDDAFVHTVTGLNNTTYEFSRFTVNLSGGGSTSKIRFEGNKASKGRFFLENLVVSQGEDLLVPVPGSPFSTSQTSYSVTGLTPGVSYFYTVTALKGTQTSSSSKEVGPVILIPTSLNTVRADVNAWVSNGKINFHAASGEVVEIYNTLGQRLYNALAVEGQNEVSVSAKGIAIVKVGNRIGKVIL